MTRIPGRRAIRVAAICLVAACGTLACAKDTTSEVTSAIQQAVTAAAPTGVSAPVWADVQHFYNARSHAPAWTAEPERAIAALRVVRRAPEHGLDAGDYGEADLSSATSDTKRLEDTLKKDPAATARLDVRLTTALLALGRDVALGRINPMAIDRRWKPRRAAPDFVTTLSMAAGNEEAGAVDGWLDTVRPRHPEYAALQKALTDMRPQNAAEGRVRTLAINLERWRWLPDDLGATHVLVNVPAFYMAVREQGRPVVEMKVVVGTPERQTPIFSATMETIVFSPYWNVPDSIAEGETAPAAARDPGFLERNHIEILRRGSDGVSAVDPSSVDWEDRDAIKALAFRQKPGAHNALGHVKFLFPNPYDVYLHDTPADALFARQGRAFSHGCIRLEKPEVLAKYLLRERPEWDAARIEKAMHQEDEQHVAMKQKLPVHIVYFTAWPDGQGGVQTWADVYGLDAKQY
jgi:murein L,D-transpeptidase YcbB/YkuD